MTWLNNYLTIDDITSRSLDVYEILLSPWGDTTAVSDSVANVFPASGGLPAPAAIAIGPRSTVDRVWVQYDLQKYINPLNIPDPNDPAGPHLINQDVRRRVSVGAPLLFPQASNRTTSFQVYPNATGGGDPTGYSTDGARYGNLYRKVDGTSGTFGSTVTEGVFIPPLLHLYLYMRPPPNGVPTHRFPWHSGQAVEIDAAGATEHLFLQIPSYGYRTFTARIRSAAANTFTYRFAGINLQQYTGGVNNVQEVNLATGTISNNDAVRVVVSPIGADYIMVYATRTNGSVDLIIDFDWTLTDE